MDVKKMETESILKMYEAIKNCLEIDDKAETPTKLYEVRRFPDWKKWADELENELIVRKVEFEKIIW